MRLKSTFVPGAGLLAVALAATLPRAEAPRPLYKAVPALLGVRQRH